MSPDCCCTFLKRPPYPGPNRSNHNILLFGRPETPLSHFDLDTLPRWPTLLALATTFAVNHNFHLLIKNASRTNSRSPTPLADLFNRFLALILIPRLPQQLPSMTILGFLATHTPGRSRIRKAKITVTGGTRMEHSKLDPLPPLPMVISNQKARPKGLRHSKSYHPDSKFLASIGVSGLRVPHRRTPR